MKHKALKIPKKPIIMLKNIIEYPKPKELDVHKLNVKLKDQSKDLKSIISNDSMLGDSINGK